MSVVEEYRQLVTVSETPEWLVSPREMARESMHDLVTRLNALTANGLANGYDVLVVSDSPQWSGPRRYWMRALRPEDV